MLSFLSLFFAQISLYRLLSDEEMKSFLLQINLCIVSLLNAVFVFIVKATVPTLKDETAIRAERG